jgi:putative inorganic carbon (HCO3(-)) transporter
MSAMFAISLARAARLISAAELLIVAAIAPALLFPTPTRLLVLALVPLVWTCSWAIGDRCVARTPLNGALGLLLTMVSVSLLATFDVRFSLGKVSGVILGALVLNAVARWATNDAKLRATILAFLAAGGCLAVIGLLGADVSDKFPLLAVASRRLPVAIRGVPGAEDGFNPNAVAGCLVLFVPLQVALLVTGVYQRLVPVVWNPRRTRGLLVLVQVGLLLLTAGTVILMQSRGAWTGLAIAFVAFLLWHSRRTRVLASAAIGGSILLVVSAGNRSWLDLAVSRSGPGVEGTVAARLELWYRALLGIQDFPFTGMGMNAFRKVMPVLYPPFLVVPDDVAHSHNHLLQAALDLGVPGLIAYLAIWLVVGTLLIGVYRRSADRTYRVIAGGLGAGLIANFTFGMTDAIPLGAKVGILVWSAWALATVLNRVSRLRHIG